MIMQFTVQVSAGLTVITSEAKLILHILPLMLFVCIVLEKPIVRTCAISPVEPEGTLSLQAISSQSSFTKDE